MWEAPLLGDPIHRSRDFGHLIGQREAGRPQRQRRLVREGTADGQPGPSDRLGLGVLPLLALPFARSHTAHVLVPLLRGVPVDVGDRPGRLPQRGKLAELVGNAGHCRGHGVADRPLPVRDHAQHRPVHPLVRLPQQRRQLPLPGYAVPNHPPHRVPNGRVPSVHRQDDMGLLPQPLPHLRRVGPLQGHYLLGALPQMGLGPLRPPYRPLGQGPPDLRHAAVLRVAQPSHQRHHLETKRAVRPHDRPFRFGVGGAMKRRTPRLLTPAHLHPELDQATQRCHRAHTLRGHPQRPPAGPALAPLCG